MLIKVTVVGGGSGRWGGGTLPATVGGGKEALVVASGVGDHR